MTYYSTVTIQTTEKAYEMIMDSVDNYEVTTENRFTPDKTYIKHSMKGWEYVIQWEKIHWSSEWEDVQAVLKALDEIDKANSLKNQYFVLCVGDNGEVETRSNSISYSCSINPRTLLNIDEKVFELIG